MGKPSLPEAALVLKLYVTRHKRRAPPLTARLSPVQCGVRRQALLLSTNPEGRLTFGPSGLQGRGGCRCFNRRLGTRSIGRDKLGITPVSHVAASKDAALGDPGEGR